MRDPVPIPWPLSSFPGSTTQESAGRLINCSAEPLGQNAPAPASYKRQAGLTLFASTALTGYRGGLIVNNLSYEVWAGTNPNNAVTVDASGTVLPLGALPGTRKITIARNQNIVPDVVAVDPDNGAYILNTATLATATGTATIGGTIFVPGDQVTLSLNNVNLFGFPVQVTYVYGASETLATIAAGLATLINANATAQANHLTATNAGPVITFHQDGNVGNSTTLLSVVTLISDHVTLTGKITGTGTESLAIVANAGGYQVTVTAPVVHAGDTVSLIFANAKNPAFPVTVTFTCSGGETADQIAISLTLAIQNNATLSSVAIDANHPSPGVITVLVPVGNTTVTFSGATLTGGAGTPGIIFTGPPLAYNGGGNLPQPNSVNYQDGYFFFTTAAGRVYASGINSLTQNALTYANIQARADVTLLRGIPFSGLEFFFTTGHCEVWQDAGNVAPNFPYARQVVLPFGLLQATAIAGWETGFDDLSWVAQDFGVWELAYASLQPQKISPPDLDRLIEAANRAGQVLEASVYMVGGKKFWVLSCPDWTWEFNLSTQQWNERTSLAVTGEQGRWRATGGHPAFGKWLVGDMQDGRLGFVDDKNFTEYGVPQLMRLESAPVSTFPDRTRVARADFNFVVGVGNVLTVPNPTAAISWSDDGGENWKVPVLRNLGPQREGLHVRVFILRLGIPGPMGRRYRIDISDPVNTPFMSATCSDDPGR